jgi:hypothetical protein
MAEIIELPTRPAMARVGPGGATVDEWGRDDRLVHLLGPLFGLRWNITCGGLHHLPARSGALLVTNQRRLSFSPLYVAWGLARATGRPVRFAGRPDIAPIGPIMQRIGALLSDPTEVRTALRHGELVVIGAAPTNHPRHAGSVDHHLVGAALAAGTPVVPVASMSSVLGRDARAEVGAPLRPRHRRRGPLGEVEMAEMAQRHIQRLLDELGGVHTGVAPIDWLAEG